MSDLTLLKSLGRPFVLLAPKGGSIPGSFRAIDMDEERHQKMLSNVQRMRADVYLSEGAITREQIDPWGRHCTEEDERAWHLVTLDDDGSIAGCARILAHETNVPFSGLHMKSAAIAQCERWGSRVRRAVQREIDAARKSSFFFVEVGGWALAEKFRGTGDALRIALAAFAWGQIAGGCLGLTTATIRHHSSSILRRIGGESLRDAGVALPRYFDPQYGCEMELLRFDSREYNPRFGEMIDRIRAAILAAPIISADNEVSELVQRAG